MAIIKVKTGGITADADNAVNSEHYTDGSIDTAHIADAQITTAKLASGVGGKVLQVIQGTTTTALSSTSTTYADTNLTANITPSASSSKILIHVEQNLNLTNDSDDRVGGGLRLLRDSTVVYGGDQPYEVFFENNSGSAIQNILPINRLFLDSPSSTSQLTYKTQGRIYQSGNAVTYNGSSVEGIIILMEIAG